MVGQDYVRNRKNAQHLVSRPRKSMKIALVYPQGLLSEEPLEEVESDLSARGIQFKALGIPPEPSASVEELIATVVLCLNSDIGQSFLVSLGAAGTYDVLKTNILRIWREVSGKSLTVLYAGGVTRRKLATLDLMVSVDDRTTLRIKLESDFPLELQESCLDKALRLVRRTDLDKLRGKDIAVFSRTEDAWRVYSQEEFIGQFLIQNRQPVNEEGPDMAGAKSGPSS